MKLVPTPLSLALWFASLGVAQASGFALIEQSASGQGLSYAGAAANTEDASVMWFNPAGLSYVDGHEVIVGAHVISPTAQFNNEGSYVKLNTGGTMPLYGAEDDGAQLGYVPNFYWKGQIGTYDLGFGVNVPYGSTVEYDQDWVGRYHAVYTSTKTMNLNPAVSRKMGNLTLGAGLNAQYIAVNLTQKVDFGTATNAQQNDGYADLEASGWAYGYNLGLMYDLAEKGKLGLAYRSRVAHHAEGTAEFSGPDAITSQDAYQDSDIQSSVTLPATFSISYDYPVNDRIKLLADATWTEWSVFDELRIEYDNPAKTDSVQPEDWTDVWRYALGATYQLNSDWVLRSGIALDHTPIKDKTLRTPRIADSNRQWISFGAGVDMTKTLHLDVGYSRLFGGQPEIEAVDSDTEAHILKGYFDINVDIFSAQLVWKY